MTDTATIGNKIPFTKMQGAGNDYIYVNTLLYNVPDPEATAIKWSDRHFGIGSDGLVLIGAPKSKDNDFSMRIFNADGSEAMMCGNASRCIGKYVYERGLFKGDTVRLETLSGVKVLKLHIEDGIVKSVTVDMGEPSFDVPAQFTGTKPAGTDGTFVSMGNPHYVNFVKEIREIDVAGRGKELEFSPSFPERCNIEFAQPTTPVTPNTHRPGPTACAPAYGSVVRASLGHVARVHALQQWLQPRPAEPDARATSSWTAARFTSSGATTTTSE